MYSCIFNEYIWHKEKKYIPFNNHAKNIDSQIQQLAKVTNKNKAEKEGMGGEGRGQERSFSHNSLCLHWKWDEC